MKSKDITKGAVVISYILNYLIILYNSALSSAGLFR